MFTWSWLKFFNFIYQAKRFKTKIKETLTFNIVCDIYKAAVVSKVHNIKDLVEVEDIFLFSGKFQLRGKNCVKKEFGN